jgi:hypothetical protein
LLLLNNVISHYLNNFLLSEKSDFLKTSHPMQLCPFIYGVTPPAPPRRGDLALAPEKIILQLMTHPGRSNREAHQTGRGCCGGRKIKIA